MKRKSSYFVLVLALLLGGNSVYAQGSLGPKLKKPRTLDDYAPGH